MTTKAITNPDALKKEAIEAALKNAGQPAKVKGETLEQKAKRLEEAFETQHKAEAFVWATCEKTDDGPWCGYRSPQSLPACPYCGAEGEATVEPLVKTTKNKAKSAAKPVAKDVVKEAEKECVDWVENQNNPAPTEEAPQKETEEIVLDLTNVPSNALVKTSVVASAELAAIDAAEAKCNELVAKGVTAKDLDTKIEEIRTDYLKGVEAASRAEREMSRSAWSIGDALRKINEGHLYLMRRDPTTGVPRYRNMKEFMHAELEEAGMMAASYAYQCMRIAAQFEQDYAEKIGAAKANLLLGVGDKVDDKTRAELVKSAPALSLSELKTKVKEAVLPPANSSTTSNSGSSSKQPAPLEPSHKKSKANDVPTNIVTLTLAQSEYEIDLYAKGKPGQRAKKIADLPVGELLTINDQRLTLEVVDHPTKGLKLRLRVARV